MSNKKRGENIRRQILKDVKDHSRDLVRHISNTFSITPQAVHLHIQRLEKDDWLTSTGKGKGKSYFLGENRKYSSLFKLSKGFTEDNVWRDHFSFIFEGIADEVLDICHYGFTEMVNNVIEHSEGKTIFISVERNAEDIIICIIDDGEGIFKRIKRLCKLADERQALMELSKGKLTTDPDNHTGEGIFFTSRVFDIFEIDSKGIKFSHQDTNSFDYIIDSDLLSDKPGTVVYMQINKKSKRSIQDVFDQFTSGPENFQFNRTVIPVRLAQYENETLVSRSQAKRLLSRIERFTNVIFDFDQVKSIGQAFADEIFRVYAQKNQHINLLPINMDKNVEKMVLRAINNVR